MNGLLSESSGSQAPPSPIWVTHDPGQLSFKMQILLVGKTLRSQLLRVPSSIRWWTSWSVGLGPLHPGEGQAELGVGHPSVRGAGDPGLAWTTGPVCVELLWALVGDAISFFTRAQRLRGPAIFYKPGAGLGILHL